MSTGELKSTIESATKNIDSKKPRKVRQCPHCKSKKGFKVCVRLGGYMELEVSFSGNIISSERQGFDDIENYSSCMECGKIISTDILDISKV